MGKKAVNLLIHTVLILFTILNVGLTVFAMFGATVSPYDNGFMALMALGLPGLLFMNLLLVLYWILRRRLWFIMPLLVLGANWQYYPRIFQFSKKDLPQLSADTNKLKVATYNINYFAYENSYELTARYVADFINENDIDVICFQEFEINQAFPPDSLASIFGLPYKASSYNSVDYHDVAIFSRYPLCDTHGMVFADSPNSAMWTDLDIDGRKIRLINAHMQTTSVNWEKDDLYRQMALGTTEDQARAAIRISNIMKKNFQRRSYQADQLVAVMDTTKTSLIFCGDTNDTPSSYTYNKLAGGNGKYPYDIINNNSTRVDGFMEVGHGYAYTYQSMKKLLRIDYIFYTPDLRGIKYESPYMRWSDHNPVVMEFQL